MSTELATSALSLSLDLEPIGRPVDDGLFKASTDQLFWFGKRLMTFDGKVFKYGHAKSALLSGYGAANNFPVSKHITYAVLPAAITVGDKFANVTCPASAGYASTGFAKDELVGGYLVVGHGAAATTQNRTIVRSDAVGASSATIRLWVDTPFTIAETTSQGAEAYPNPYGYLYQGNLEHNAFMGVAQEPVASGSNAWIQTWGPCWVVPGGGDTTPGEGSNNRMMYFVGDGSVNSGLSVTIENGYQPAGFLIDTTSASVAAMPLIMLQISI